MISTVAKAALGVNENLIIQKRRLRNGVTPKRISIVTGTHGDELEGQYLAYLIGSFLDKNLDKLNGIVDIYPALNPLGIDSISRGIPMFDLDMNRVFPGSKNGTMAEVLCASIVEDLLGSDVCIDVHSSNIFLREIPQIRISVPTAYTLVPYAKMMNVDFIWVHESATVLESTLAHTLMREPILSLGRDVGFVNSDAAGVFVPCAQFGDTVRKGDHIGDVLDPLTGTVTEKVEAICDGLIFTLREYPIVYGGSLLARILMPEKGENAE